MIEVCGINLDMGIHVCIRYIINIIGILATFSEVPGKKNMCYAWEN